MIDTISSLDLLIATVKIFVSDFESKNKTDIKN